ncbi:MAG: TIGR00295 family protein [Thermoplasmata archaeon]|nr:TIGR00295 family protein [Thermoplasmata archaeon]
MIPTIEQCLSFLAEENCPNAVIEHCMAVELLAMKITLRITKDRKTLDLVSMGALLHDIGRSRTHGIEHAYLGADILRKRGLDEAIVRIVERHIGAGINPEEADILGLPPRNYMPETLAEKIVAHADNLITHDDRGPARWKVADAVARERGKGHEAQAVRIEKLHTELSELAAIDLDEI